MTSVRFHSTLPLIISSAEEQGEKAGAVRIWNAELLLGSGSYRLDNSQNFEIYYHFFRLESTINDDLGRAWCVAALNDTVAVGYDKGCVVHTIKKKTDVVRSNV